MYYEDLKMCSCVTENAPPITPYHDEMGYCGIIRHFNPQGGSSYVYASSDTSRVQVARNPITWVATSTEMISESTMGMKKSSDTVTMTSVVTGMANNGWNFTNKINITGGGSIYFDTRSLLVGEQYRMILIGDVQNSVRCSVYVNGKALASAFFFPGAKINTSISFTYSINEESPELRNICLEFPSTYTGFYNIRALAICDPDIISLTGSKISTGIFNNSVFWCSNQTAQVRYPILPEYSGTRLIFNAHSLNEYPADIPDIGMFKYARITGQVVNASGAAAIFTAIATITYDSTVSRWRIETTINASGLSFAIAISVFPTGEAVAANITGLPDGFTVDLLQLEVNA